MAKIQFWYYTSLLTNVLFENLLGTISYLFIENKAGSSNTYGIANSEWKILAVGNVSIPRNLDEYIKPLDIIKVEKTLKLVGKSYQHAGVYLGRNQVFHFYDWGKTERMKARIDNIEQFLEENSTSVVTGEITRYHLVVPFKRYQKVIEHLVKADHVRLWEGEYNVGGKNCEHLVNMVVRGIYFSEQSPFVFTLGGEVDLKNSIESSNRELNNLTSLELRSERNRYEARVEIPPKQDCQVM